MFEQLITNLINFFKNRRTAYKNFFKDRRIEFNYEKKGLMQIFPLLYVENDNERAFLWGLGKYNIAFIKGRNVVPESTDLTSNPQGIPNMDERGLFSDYKKNPKGLTNNQKTMMAIVVIGVVAIGVLVAYKHFKKHKQ